MLLVTGATGTIGRPLVRLLRAAGIGVRSTSRYPPADPGGAVRFDFREPGTWEAAFDGVESMFLVRPPDLANVRRDLLPALQVARRQGVRHVVFLSVQGAGAVPVLPHAKVEKWLRGAGLRWTFIRPSYFAQNLSGVLASDIRDGDRIVVPAGRSRTAFVDAYDVAEVAALVLQDLDQHAGRIWTPTGPALTYGEVAETLSAELGRTIRYTNPGIVAYARHARGQLGMPASLVAVSTVLHAVARLGLADNETRDVEEVTGHPPTSFAEFARRERSAWLR